MANKVKTSKMSKNMAKKTTKAKKVTMAKTIKKQTSKKRLSLPLWLPKSLPGRLVMIIAIVVFGWVGARFLARPFAFDPNGVPTAQDQLIAQFEEAHSHEFMPDTIIPFHPSGIMLYGDGLLVCSTDSPSPKKGYEITTGKLTQSQIDDFMKQVNRHKPDSEEQAKHDEETTASHPIQALDQIIINYNKGAVALFGNYDSHTQGFSSIKVVFHSTCQKYAKDKYESDKYIALVAPVSEESVKDYDEVDTSLPPPTSEETSFKTLINKDEAKAIIEVNGGNNFAKFHKDGKPYVMQIIPTFRQFKDPVISRPTDESKVEASSYLATKWYWVYPYGQSLSSLSSEAASVSSHVRAFYKSQTDRDNSASAPVNLALQQTTAYYQTTCPAGVNCADTSSEYNSSKPNYKNARAWKNIKAEMIRRCIVPGGNTSCTTQPPAASYNFLYQGPPQAGWGHCDGWGEYGGNGNVANSRGGLAVTFGYGSTATGSCQMTNYPSIHYWTATHEMGHTLGLLHPSMTCASTGPTYTNYIMTACGASVSSAWPGSWIFTSTQESQLRASSLFLNNLVKGRVVYSGTSTGVPNIKITSCNTLDPDTLTTSSSDPTQVGYFTFRFPTRSGYCLHMTAPTGYRITTQNNPDHMPSDRYDWQVAGYNCYNQPVSTACNSSQVTWDMSTDFNKNFILVKQ